MIAQLLEATANSPVRYTHPHSDAQRYDCASPAECQRQGHTDKSHHQDAKWIDVLSLQCQRQRRDVNAALFGRFQITP